MSKNSEKITKEGLLHQTELLATPIDYENLIMRGILEKKGRGYRILSMKDLPEHVRMKIISIRDDGTVTFSNATKQIGKLIKKLSK